jgi:hypothetical protein
MKVRHRVLVVAAREIRNLTPPLSNAATQCRFKDRSLTDTNALTAPDILAAGRPRSNSSLGLPPDSEGCLHTC